MRRLVVNGGQRVSGSFFSSGAKNSALFLIVAALFFDDVVEINNIPRIRDIDVIVNMIKNMNVNIDYDKDNKKIKIYNQSNMTNHIDFELAKQVRVSVVLMCPLIYRFNEVFVPFPGGDKIGERSLDELFRAFDMMGVRCTINPEGYFLKKEKKFSNFDIDLKCKSHTVTMCLIMLASVIQGNCNINNYSTEKEIFNLIDMFRYSGVSIDINENNLNISGNEFLKTTVVSVIPDRIEIASYILAALITSGKISINKNDFKALDNSFLNVLKNLDISIVEEDDNVKIIAKNEYNSQNLITGPSPGLSTDLQNMFVVFFNKCITESKIKETVFEDRFKQFEDFINMGMEIIVNRDVAIVKRVRVLNDECKLFAKDIRGGFSLILLALQLSYGQKAYIYNIDIIERGYEDFIGKFKKLGITIEEEWNEEYFSY